MQGNFSVFDMPFAAAPRVDVLNQVVSMAHGQKSACVLFANAHVVVEAHQNAELHNLLKQADLIIPDGVPISWVMQAKGKSQAQRYSGPDLMVDVLVKDPEAKHFFLGSTDATLKKIEKKFKGNAVGFYSPPFSKESFSEDELEKQLKIVEQSQADYIWVGLGAPKQERYVVQMSRKAKKGLWLAVGAAFDFYAGNKPRAPHFLQNMGLEWAFRMAAEPRRLTKRYLFTNPVFIKLALEEIFLKGSRRDE